MADTNGELGTGPGGFQDPLAPTRTGVAINNLGEVAFASFRNDISSDTGIYTTAGGPVRLVANNGTFFPGVGTFQAVAAPRLNDAGTLTFFGDRGSSAPQGIFRTAFATNEVVLEVQGDPFDMGCT